MEVLIFYLISTINFNIAKTLNEVIDKLEEVIQTLTAYQLKSIVHRDWTSAIFDFN